MDPFALLTGGARFTRNDLKSQNKNKNKSQKREAISDSDSDDSESEAKHGAKLVKNKKTRLDFFKTEEVTTTNTSQKRKRRREDPAATSTTADVDPETTSDGTGPWKSDEQVNIFRKKNRIYLKGTDVPRPILVFEELLDAPTYPISKYVLEAMVGLGFSAPTPIQHQAIPIMLARRDLLAVAPTGSGKTLAFALPVIATLQKPMAKGFRAVVVSPTRELAQQTKRVFDLLAAPTRLNVRLLDKSNNSSNNFGKKSSQRFDILITTPLRLVHGISKESISLSHVEWLVLDEADRLFENGFDEQVDEVIAACSKKGRSMALFSATMPQRVEELARTVLLDPVRIRVGEHNAATSDVEQKLIFCGNENGKLLAMRQLLQEGLKPPVIVFVQSKGRAKELFHELVYEGLNVDLIHADRTKEQRDEVSRQFRSGKVWVLICTDLMARGLDFLGVNVVINYDFPANAVDYIHRVGRTGRAGRQGKAITFFTEADGGSLKKIANVMRSSGCDVPSWMFEVKNKHTGRTRIIDRESISTSVETETKTKKRKARKPKLHN